MLRVVFLNKGKCYRRELCKNTIAVNSGQYKLPHNHYSAGYIERVWGARWHDFPAFTIPSVQTLLDIQITGKINKYSVYL